MFDDEQRHGRIERHQQIRQRPALGGRQAGGWFVEHHDLWFSAERQGDLELALLTVGERCDDDLQTIVQADARGDLSSASLKLIIAMETKRPQLSPLGTNHGKVDVLGARKPRKEPGRLVGPRETKLDSFPRRGQGDILPKDLHLSSGWVDLTGQQVEEGRLPGPVRSQDGTPFAAGHVQIDAGDCLDASEATAEPADA